MGLDGIEIFTNSSASYHELRKADHRVNLVKSATTKVNQLYIYFWKIKITIEYSLNSNNTSYSTLPH